MLGIGRFIWRGRHPDAALVVFQPRLKVRHEGAREIAPFEIPLADMAAPPQVAEARNSRRGGREVVVLIHRGLSTERRFDRHLTLTITSTVRFWIALCKNFSAPGDFCVDFQSAGRLLPFVF